MLTRYVQLHHETRKGSIMMCFDATLALFNALAALKYSAN